MNHDINTEIIRHFINLKIEMMHHASYKKAKAKRIISSSDNMIYHDSKYKNECLINDHSSNSQKDNIIIR